MRTKKVEIVGLMPLIMHKNDVMSEAKIAAWRKNPENKAHSVKGDDRSPAWTWTSYVYHMGDRVGIPSDNLMTMLREGGAKVPLPKGNARETFKRVTQSGLLVTEPMWEIETAGGEVCSYDVFEGLVGEHDFERHMDVAARSGVDLFVKRVKVGQSYHVRVRPQWAAGWKIRGEITILDEQITDQAFSDILSMAGRYCGLCDWRPSSPKSPGPYGTFEVSIS